MKVKQLFVSDRIYHSIICKYILLMIVYEIAIVTNYVKCIIYTKCNTATLSLVVADSACSTGFLRGNNHILVIENVKSIYKVRKH